MHNRLPLKLFAGDPVKLKLGRFVADLGKFEQSGKFGEVEFYLVPAQNPLEEPGALDAAGCKNFETSGLVKKLPDGYTREARRKTIMSEADAEAAIRQRDEARQRLRDKLQDIANDQGEVFRPKRK